MNDEKTNWLSLKLNAVSLFIEELDLIILAVLVNMYHITKALALHDPIWVSVLIAFFLDVLHFKSVQQAVRSNKLGWWIPAILLTVMTYSIQYRFYNDANGGFAVLDLESLINSGVLPIGIFLWALISEKRIEPIVATLEKQLKATTGRNEDLEIKVNSAESNLIGTEEKLKDVESKLKHVELKYTHAEEWIDSAKDSGKQVEDLKRENEGLVESLNSANEKLNELEDRVDQLKSYRDRVHSDYEKMKLIEGGLGGYVKALIDHAVGSGLETQAEIAELYGVSNGKVSSDLRLIRSNRSKIEQKQEV